MIRSLITPAIIITLAFMAGRVEAGLVGLALVLFILARGWWAAHRAKVALVELVQEAEEE